MKKRSLYLAMLLASTQSLAAEWDYPLGNVSVSNFQEALTYLEQAYPEVGSLRFRYERQSKLGHHYNFDVLVAGEYKQQRTIVLSTNNDDQVSRIFRSLEDTVLLSGQPTTAAELEAPRQLEAERAPELSSGQLVSAKVNVFSPDLRTMDRSASPETLLTDITHYPNVPQYVEATVDVLDHIDGIYLSNSRLSQVDAIALVAYDPDSGELVSRDTSNFLAPEGITRFDKIEDLQLVGWQDNRFLQLMAFTHLDQSLRYIEDLGFSLFEQPLEFDGRGLSADNSTYYFGPKAALFGIAGGSPDALDADVILHELGHGIHYQIVRDWAYGHTGAIGEGFGDYWAGAFSFRTQYENAQTQGQEFEIDTVFNWDGYFGVRKTTRSLWNQRARYFRQAEYRAHESVAGELGDELWSTPLFQALKVGVERYGHVAFQEFDSIVLESMYGVGRGVKMHDLAESMLFVAKALYPDRDYAQILKEKFDVHNLIIEPFVVETKGRYVHPENSLDITIHPTLRQPQWGGEVDIDGLTQSFDSATIPSLAIQAELPTGKVCGSAVPLNTTIDYQYSASLKEHSWQHDMVLVYGLPSFSTPVKEVNGYLPDSRHSPNNQPIVGFKTFNFTVEGSGQTVGENFGLYLDIDHSRLSDLAISLVSPRGTKVALINHQSTTFDGFEGYLTFKYDSLLDEFKNEPLNGTWRLEVGDYVEGETGQLNRWVIGNISHYECGDAAAKEQGSSSSSGGSVSPFILLLAALLSFGRAANTRTLSFLTMLFKKQNKKITL